MSVIVILGKKCTLAASRAAQLVSHAARPVKVGKTGQTDGRTDIRPMHFAYRWTKPAQWLYVGQTVYDRT